MAQTPQLKGKLAAGGVGAGAMALAISIIAPWEGKRNDPYFDIVGVKTVCYGETQNVQDKRYTDAECRDMLVKAVESRYMKPVIQCTPEIKDNPELLAAATSLAYNIGTKAYCGSTVAKRFKAYRFREGCDGFRSWVYAGGKRVQGLANRREAERSLCLRGLS